MLGQESIVEAPDGRSWKVRRRWVERPVPNLRERWRRSRKEVDGEDVFDGMLVLDGAEGFGAIGLAVGIALVVLILFPLLGVALELVVLLLVLVYGVFARVVLRRPWIVDAVAVGDAEERVAFAVQGWRESGAALRELRTAIAAAGPPQRLTVGRPLATKPGGG
ncbi:MAG TPA: hypothetical protein VFU16_02595 [Solirubrobacterales bacterium]|nr:hypothetical protein [Solirubrobacterales bacterium]